MLPEEPVAIIGLRHQIPSQLSQIIETVVLDTPEVDQSVGGSRHSQEAFASVGKGGAVSKAAFAEIVGRESPLGAFKRVCDAAELVHVPIGQNLRSKDIVIANANPIDIETWFGQACGKLGPIKDRHTTHVQVVVTAVKIFSEAGSGVVQVAD